MWNFICRQIISVHLNSVCINNFKRRTLYYWKLCTKVDTNLCKFYAVFSNPKKPSRHLETYVKNYSSILIYKLLPFLFELRAEVIA
jgi:hypothetical protein